MQQDRVTAPFTLLAVATALALYRGWVVVHSQLPLFVDEAQYWIWSLTPDWGYFSKPPMVAWIIAGFSVFGDDELAVRLGTLLLHPLTAGLVYLLGRRMFDERTALCASVLFLSLPLVGFNSLFMTTDAPLFFFWGLSCLALYRAVTGNGWLHWTVLGVAAGFGLLSKYSMAVFAVSAAVVLCLPDWRRHWKNPRLYLASGLALLIFLPNLLWNARMDFVSFRHTAQISRLDQALFHPQRFAEFLAAQFACMGPVAFALLLVALCRRAIWRDGKLAFLAAVCLPFLAVISMQALLARANANWAAPAYFGASLLVAACWFGNPQRRRMFAATVILNLLLVSVFYHYRSLAQWAGVELTRGNDPYTRVLGWPELGTRLREVLAERPGRLLAVTSREEFALLRYYARPQSAGMRIWNPAGENRHHFQMAADMRDAHGADFILASRERLDSSVQRAFVHWTPLGEIAVPIHRGELRRLHLYAADGFRGYPE